MNLNNIQNFSSNVVFACLSIAMICYWINLSLFNKTNFLSNFGKKIALLANGILFFILCSRWIVAGYFPLSNLYESLLFLTWILLSLYIYIELQTKTKLIGAILIPVAVLINGFANLTLSPEMQKSSPLVPALQSNWLMLHVSMMLLSYATLIMGSLLCILFLVISRFKEIDLKRRNHMCMMLAVIIKKLEYLRLKKSSFEFDTGFDITMLNLEVAQLIKPLQSNSHRRYKSYHRMFNACKKKGYHFHPENFESGKLLLLQRLDNWSYRIIGLGFPFLTMGIISGGVWANEAWGSYWSWDPKETWALITWLVFTSYLHARIVKGWEGRNSAILGGLGFFVIWICYLGVNFLGKGLHSYGWV